MGVEINIGNTKISGNARVLNETTIKNNSDVKINVLDSEINGQAVVLENLKIDSILEELKQKVGQMDKDSKEYLEIQAMLGAGQEGNKNMIERIKKHLLEFSQGVLASIVANMLT